ncbi:MAG: response regulator transcription factor [Solirubrobacteraceae bacterium]
MPVDPIRVVLADNHAAMRRSLRLLLDGEADVHVVAEVGDLAAVMREVHQHQPRVLVLDLGMCNGSSIEVIGRLRREVPGAEIVVLTMEEGPAFERRAIDAGAIGLVLKDRAPGELAAAIRGAAHGERHVSADVSADVGANRYSPRPSAVVGG